MVAMAQEKPKKPAIQLLPRDFKKCIINSIGIIYDCISSDCIEYDPTAESRANGFAISKMTGG
jgi:hypothetical protein